LVAGFRGLLRVVLDTSVAAELLSEDLFLPLLKSSLNVRPVAVLGIVGVEVPDGLSTAGFLGMKMGGEVACDSRVLLTLGLAVRPSRSAAWGSCSPAFCDVFETRFCGSGFLLESPILVNHQLEPIQLPFLELRFKIQRVRPLSPKR
jgi:hypothetical protein